MAAGLSETDDELQASTLGLSEAEESGTETDRLEDLPHSVTSPDSLSAAAIPEQFSNLKVPRVKCLLRPQMGLAIEIQKSGFSI